MSLLFFTSRLWFKVSPTVCPSASSVVSLDLITTLFRLPPENIIFLFLACFFFHRLHVRSWPFRHDSLSIFWSDAAYTKQKEKTKQLHHRLSFSLIFIISFYFKNFYFFIAWCCRALGFLPSFLSVAAKYEKKIIIRQPIVIKPAVRTACDRIAPSHALRIRVFFSVSIYRY